MNVAVPVKKPNVKPVEERARPRRHASNTDQQVGIKDIYHPIKVKDRARGEQHTVANFNMYVNLPHNFKGTHMSRFVEILHRHEREISGRFVRQDARGNDGAFGRDPPVISR